MFMDETSYGLLILLPLVTLLIAVYQWLPKIYATKKLPLPPGPKPLPLLGNLLQIPNTHQWLTYANWAQEYGDIMHASFLDKHIIVLNSFEAVNELLEKRSSHYSSRPRLPMLKELSGWHRGMSFMEYGPIWKKSRKVFHQNFNLNVSKRYCEVQVDETHKMLLLLLENPGDFRTHIRHVTTATIMRVVYGIQIEDSDDKYIQIAEAALNGLALAGNPGSFLVDILPILKYVPEWFPGAAFQKKARFWRDAALALFNVPFEAVKKTLLDHEATPSIAANLLQQLATSDNPDEDELIARGVSAIAYTGGADTTTSSMSTFILAMMLHPKIQRRAQEELDRVVGSNRLPDFSDRSALPYVNAVIKEVLRWQPVTPLAVAHTNTVDDEYKGFRIPKGSTIIPNAWSILHDEKIYPDPFSFIPERFLLDGKLNLSVMDPDEAAFGFGRQKCPGRYMADNGLFIAVASILHCFTLTSTLKESWVPEGVHNRMSPGLLSYPEEYECSIEPRSDHTRSLIHRHLTE